MPEPLRNMVKASLLKMFVIDDEGNYSGEYTIYDECGVEFGDVVKAVGNTPMTDMQSISLGEYSVTAMHGGSINLITVSKGPLSAEELMWAKTTLTAAEDQFLHGNRQSKVTPDKKLITELEALRERVGNMESQIREERRKHEEEKEELRRQLVSVSSPPPPSKAEQEAKEEGRRLLEEWKAVQRRIAELIEQETKLQQANQSGQLTASRQEQLRKEIAALKF